MMGRMAAFGALTAKGLRGWTGVPKAGEDEGIAADEDGMRGRCRRKMGAGVWSIVAASDYILVMICLRAKNE